ncbi:MAG: hypothetical protein IH857_01945 [Deltaproteobacteria bacterium]|nr:hypothetical protein [Deltaproteobacteria bacterium]
MNRFIHQLIASIVFFTGKVLLAGCGKSSEPKLEPVSITTPRTSPNWLMLVAIDQGFFMNEGLDVTPKYYPSGLRAFHEMLRGEVDIFTTAEVPFVFSSSVSSASLWLFFKHRSRLTQSGTLPGSSAVIIGLIAVRLFHLTHLFTRSVLPIFTGRATAMRVMKIDTSTTAGLSYFLHLIHIHEICCQFSIHRLKK